MQIMIQLESRKHDDSKILVRDFGPKPQGQRFRRVPVRGNYRVNRKVVVVK
jgi:hypothetical protein